MLCLGYVGLLSESAFRVIYEVARHYRVRVILVAK